MIIAIDGLDASGKSTYIERLKDYFEHHPDHPKVVRILRNPGGTAFGELLRSHLKGVETKRHPGTDLLAFGAIFNDVIHEALRESDNGKLVFIDRFLLSAFGYQWSLSGLKRETEIYYRLLIPTMHPRLSEIHHIWIDVEPEVLLERIKARGQSEGEMYESTHLNSLMKIREGYEFFMRTASRSATCETNIEGLECVEGKLLAASLERYAVEEDHPEIHEQVFHDLVNYIENVIYVD